VDADGGVGELAHEGQAAVVVDVAVGDEDGGDGRQADGVVVLFGDGRNAGQQVVVGFVVAGAAVYQDELVAVADEVDVVDEAGEGAHGKGIDNPPAAGGEFLDGCHEGIIELSMVNSQLTIDD